MTTPKPDEQPTIPRARRAVALIGREVREVEWIPTPAAPAPPPRSTYRGPAQWGDETKDNDA